MGKINYDDGTIRLDNDWYTVAELRDKIADMLASGNYKINKYSRALEELDGKMEGAESIYAVLTAKTLNDLDELISKTSRSKGDIIREALTTYLRS